MDDICHKNWTKQREAHVPSGPRSMRVVHDEIWQCHRQGISVFDHDLNLKRTMACGNISMVSDVADVGNGNVILASYDGLYCMSVEGKTIKFIRAGRFTSVIYHRDLIYTFDMNSNYVYVFQQSDSWNRIRSFKVWSKEGSTHFITLAAMNGKLYVCVPLEHTIDVYSLSGKFQKTCGISGSQHAGELDRPYICCRLGNLGILVADQRNERLQVINAKHRWHILSLRIERQSDPRSALFIGDRLLVNFWKSQTIAFYN